MLGSGERGLWARVMSVPTRVLRHLRFADTQRAPYTPSASSVCKCTQTRHSKYLRAIKVLQGLQRRDGEASTSTKFCRETRDIFLKQACGSEVRGDCLAPRLRSGSRWTPKINGCFQRMVAAAASFPSFHPVYLAQTYMLRLTKSTCSRLFIRRAFPSCCHPSRKSSNLAANFCPFPQPRPLMKSPAFIRGVDERCLASDKAKSTAFGHIQALEDVIKECKAGAGVWARGDRFTTEVASIKAEYKPQVTVAVLGATGAGKSSLINAILEDEIVPTSGMAACTSVVTEISYNEKDTHEADVHFLTELEWRQEVLVLLQDLQEDSGEKDSDRFSPWRDCGPSSADATARIAWAKVHAVYPDLALHTLSGLDVDAVLDHSQDVLKLLGTTVHIEAKTSGELAGLMAPYITSQEQDHGPDAHSSIAYWPLIRQIKVRCPAHALSTGTVLVDLPGVVDANAARASIASEYMQKCDHFWIATPVTRAVNDKTAYDLLGNAFRAQMRLDGRLDPSAFTIVVTKCDDISSKEIVNELHLHRDLQYRQLEIDLRHHKAEVARWKTERDNANVECRNVDENINDLKAQLARVRQRLDVPLDSTTTPLKRIRPEDSEPSGNVQKQPRVDGFMAYSSTGFILVPDGTSGSANVSSENSQEAPNEAEALQQRMNDCEATLAVFTQRSQEAKERLQEAQDNVQRSREMLNAFCAAERSKYTISRFQTDFKAGVAVHGIVTSEDVPVFNISARDFVRLSGDGDEPALCFVNKEDTNVPALQQWCHALALPVREVAMERLYVRLRASAESLRSFIEDSPGIKSDDRDAMILQWESPMDDCSERDFRSRPTRYCKAEECHFQGITWRLINNFREVVNRCVCDLQDTAEECLQEKCEEATDMASQVAVEICDDFAESMHWQTYLATIRRDGSWWKGDLNVDLLTPFSSHIATGWCDLFARDFFSSLQSETLRLISAVSNEVTESVPDYLQARAKQQVEVCMTEAQAALGDIIPTVQGTVQGYRKTISRRLAPRIEAELFHGYNLAKVERGHGCVARQKAIIHSYVEKKRHTAFQLAAKDLTEGLKEAANSIEEQLDNALSEVARTVEKNMSVLWDGPVLVGDGEDVVGPRMRMIGVLDRIISEIDARAATP